MRDIHEHRSDLDGMRIYSILISLSGALRIILSLVSVLFLFLLFSINVGEGANPVEIYVRNISSVVAILILCIFFDSFHRSHLYSYNSMMSPMKIATKLLLIACAIKVVISIYYLFFCIVKGNAVLWYYVGEIVVWGAVALFAYYYLKRLSE